MSVRPRAQGTKKNPAPLAVQAGARVGAHAAVRLGRVARRLREELGLTLADAADRARISAGMLSRLETGRVSPSLETIVALSKVLGVRPSVLLQEIGDEGDSAQHTPAGHGLAVARRGARRRYTYYLLAAPRGPTKAFEPFLVTLADKSEVFPGFQHAGTEFMYLLSGEMSYRHGQATYRLKAGDSLTFRGDVPHGPETLRKVPVRMLSVIIYDSATGVSG